MRASPPHPPRGPDQNQFQTKKAAAVLLLLWDSGCIFWETSARSGWPKPEGPLGRRLVTLVGLSCAGSLVEWLPPQTVLTLERGGGDLSFQAPYLYFCFFDFGLQDQFCRLLLFTEALKSLVGDFMLSGDSGQPCVTPGTDRRESGCRKGPRRSQPDSTPPFG